MSNFDISLIKDLTGLDFSQDEICRIINNSQLRELMEKFSALPEELSYEQRIELLKSLSPIKDYILKSLETEVEYSKLSVDAEKSASELIRKAIENGSLSQKCTDDMVRETSERLNKEQEHRHKNEDADRKVNRIVKLAFVGIALAFLSGLFVSKKNKN